LEAHAGSYGGWAYPGGMLAAGLEAQAIGHWKREFWSRIKHVVWSGSASMYMYVCDPRIVDRD
jgi:hypothetical protein